MAEAYRISPDDQSTYGFRQLRAVGPAGAELSHMVYVGMSIVLGILTGTVLADGSWRAIIPAGSHDSAQFTFASYEPPSVPVASSTQTSPVLPLAVNSASSQTSAASQTTASAKSTATTGHRSVHVPVSGKRHRRGHRGHSRHRLHAHVKPAVPARLPASLEAVNTVPAVEPVDAPKVVAFTIQGDATVFNYDVSAGILQTYEGQSFALDKSASASNAATWEDYSGRVHYTCDQAGNCTLFRAGIVILNARRTT